MAVKAFEIEGIGTLHVYKRKGVRTVRLSISADGRVRLTIPYWSTYAAGIDFARSRSDWIQANTPEPSTRLLHGQQIGKAHRLVFERTAVEKPTARIAGSSIRVLCPPQKPAHDEAVQTAARKGSIRALRLQAAKLLPVRLRRLADQYGFTYRDVSVRELKGRWGSCDSKQNITLNLYLMQLPWHLIDYVLLHELVHTKHMNHSKEFWAEFMRHEPRAKALRAEIRQQRPVLDTVVTPSPVS